MPRTFCGPISTGIVSHDLATGVELLRGKYFFFVWLIKVTERQMDEMRSKLLGCKVEREKRKERVKQKKRKK